MTTGDALGLFLGGLTLGFFIGFIVGMLTAAESK